MLTLVVPLSASGDEPAFVIPGGQDRLVGEMLGAGGPLRGCTLGSAAIEATRIVARYDCGPGHETVRITLGHPANTAAQFGRTRFFAIAAADGDRPPPEFVEALRVQLQSAEGAFVWTSPDSDRAFESGRDQPPRAARGGSTPASSNLDARGLLIIAIAAACVVALRKRRAFVFVAPLLLAATLLATLRAVGNALAGASLGTSGEPVRSALVALAGIASLAVFAWFWARREQTRRTDTAVLLGGFTILAALGLASSLRPREKPPRFGAIYTVHAHGLLAETDPRRPQVDYRINAHGFRGIEWPERAEEGTFRGAVIGDSSVMGVGLQWPDTISERLAAGLRAPGTPGRVEVLNLGIAGNNLAQHVSVYETARTRLQPDFVVLCLTLPNALSDWSIQDEIADLERLSPLSTMAFAFGRASAATWLARSSLAQAADARALRVLDREMSRLGEDRRRNGGPPLFVFAYSFEAGIVESRIRGWRDTWLVPPVASQPGFTIAGDGHPTAAANRVYGARIVDAILGVPSLAARLRP